MDKLGFGLMRLPRSKDDYNKIKMDRFQEMVDAFLEAGGTYFDTAYIYHGGYSEQAFREAVVKRHPRNRYTITDKLPMFMIKNAEQMPAIFDEQLERCGVSYFDYYLLHSLGRESYATTQRIKAFEFISKKKEEGRIRHIGFSFHDSPEVLEQILSEHPEVEYVQLQINYLDWDDAIIQAKDCYEVAVKHGKQVIVMEPIKGGALADVPKEAEKAMKDYAPNLSVASWAVRFAASLENVCMVLSGMSNMEQLEDNISYMKNFKKFNSDEIDLVMNAAKIIRSNIAISCTACQYCVDTCPEKIAIPDYFNIYNNLKRFATQKNAAKTDYKNIIKDHGRASACILCGNCEEHCPQRLSIREYLKDVASVLE